MSNYLNTVRDSRFAASARSLIETMHANNNANPASIKELLDLWISRFKQRRALGNLPDHLLKDIGISRQAALEEACKPFWQK